MVFGPNMYIPLDLPFLEIGFSPNATNMHSVAEAYMQTVSY